MNIDISDPMAYENLSMVLDEYDRSLLRNGRREDILATANAPLVISEGILDFADDSLKGLRDARDGLDETEQPPEHGLSESVERLRGEGISRVTDVDILDLLSDDPDAEDAGAFARRYIEDCLGCSLRLRADWQLQPLSLMGPIDAFLDQLNATLDGLAARINPFDTLKDICQAMNFFSSWCIQDLIMLLMSLKLLLKKYLNNTLKIKLDWTTIIGPILNAIVQGLSTLVENIFNIAAAPLDCALSGMRTANALERELRAFPHTIKEDISVFKSQVKDGTSLDWLIKDISWDTESISAGSLSPTHGASIGELETSQRTSSQDRREGSTPILSGFVLTENIDLSEALRDPNFPHSTFLEKLIIPVGEAFRWLKETMENILRALDSLKDLVGGGLSLNINNLGVMLFITDMISFVMMIIRMLRLNPDVTDWCTMLEENPEVLEQQLRTRFGDRLTVEAPPALPSELLIRNGPDVIGRIRTCTSNRSNLDSQLIDQWISDLQSKGS